MPRPLATLAVISHERPVLRDRAVESALASISRSGAVVPVLVIDSSQAESPVPAGACLVHRPSLPMCVSKRRLSLELSETEWVIMLDDDCRALPGAVGALLDAISADEGETAAFFVGTEFHGPATRMFQAAQHSDLAAGFGESADDDIAWGVTTLAAFRRKAALSASVFDGRYLSLPVGGEDVDACVKLRTAGWRLRQLPGVLAQHDTQTWSTFTQNSRRSRNYGAAEGALLLLHPRHARTGFDNLVPAIGYGVLCASLTGRLKVREGLIAGLAGWLAAELAEKHADHQDATALELTIQALWSACYEFGRLRTAIARRDLRPAVCRFNWETSTPTGYSHAISGRIARRLATTVLAAAGTAAALELGRRGRCTSSG